jgi:hypothetical protein
LKEKQGVQAGATGEVSNALRRGPTVKVMQALTVIVQILPKRNRSIISFKNIVLMLCGKQKGGNSKDRPVRKPLY